MEVSVNGAVVVAELGEHDLVNDLLCVCGHKLSQRASWVQLFYPDSTHSTYHQSQCVSCGIKDDKFVCGKFRIK